MIGLIIDYLLISLFITSNMSLAIFSFGGNYFPEVAIFLLALRVYGSSSILVNFIRRVVVSNISVILYFLISAFIIMIIGFIRGGDFINSYAEFRSIVVGFFSFIIISSSLGEDESVVGSMYIIALLSGIFSILLYFIAGYVGFVQDTSKYASPIYACVFCVFVSVYNKWFYRALLSLIVGVVLAGISFYRQYSLLMIILLVYFLVNGRLMGAYFGYRAFVLGFVVFFVSIVGYGAFERAIEEDESMYIQSVGKTEDLFNVVEGRSVLTESDELRASYFSYMYNRWYKLILPHGLGSKGFYGKMDEWFSGFDIPENPLDSIVLYAAFSFGYILIVPLLIYFVPLLIKFSKGNGLWTGCFLFATLLIPLLFDGGAVVVLPRCASLGMLFGLLHLRSCSPRFDAR